MRETHHEQIVRWANFVKNNPHKWKKIHTEFINAIFDKHEQFVKNLTKMEHGEEKLRKLREIRLNQSIINKL